MNIIDAIKSGRPFRRGHHSNPWLVWSEAHKAPACVDNIPLGLGKDSLLADDWEIQEPTVTITKSQFWEAVSAAERLFWPDPAAKVLARCLGLEPPK